jgi:hypothetical protein
MRHRVCDWPHCKTVLSRFNAGPRCWTHQGDLTQPLTQAQIDLLRPRSTIISDDFIRNLPGAYDFTADERANYKRGAW